MMHEAVIVDAVRSPMGKGKTGGSLSEVHAVDLLAQVLKGLVERNAINPKLIDDIIVGCVTQAGEHGGTPGRMAALAAGFPESIPSTTIDRKCGSSQQAVHFAAQGIMSGAYRMTIAAGIESMSRVPMGSARLGQDGAGPLVAKRYAPGLINQGIAAELVNQRWQLDRETLDSYAVRSHQRAATHTERGLFQDEIIPIQTPNGLLNTDETIRPNSSSSALAELEPAFRNSDSHSRFPDIDWKVTAGNSSQITDGASALLIMERSLAESLGLKPLARFIAFDVIADDPLLMLTAPIPATRRVLEKARLGLDNIDHFEINEAFASVPLAWQKEFGVDNDRLNPCGGAIALGHPLGASGARLMTTMLHSMHRNGDRYGLQTMCEAGGMANATIIERLS
ncbi:putative acyl-CoA thiolase [Vreelandella aquamarina]|uniref:Acyl-CoA thiolase n=1 Tax=Vreelandella aquamarina TaxID=77097 RepID=A0A6F8XGG2_9GAMM|nr:thiolase family protein [Halomonas meridiana]BCB72583.1 putative acyl-CoA thiolase [Halomonas meridiana]